MTSPYNVHAVLLTTKLASLFRIPGSIPFRSVTFPPNTHTTKQKLKATDHHERTEGVSAALQSDRLDNHSYLVKMQNYNYIAYGVNLGCEAH